MSRRICYSARIMPATLSALVVLLPLFAHSLTRLDITGCWMEVAHEVRGKFISIEQGRVFTFTEAGVFRVSMGFSVNPRGCDHTGNWQWNEDQRTVLLKTRYVLCTSPTSCEDSLTYHLDRVDDRGLVLIDSRGNQAVKIHFVRVGSSGLTESDRQKDFLLRRSGTNRGGRKLSHAQLVVLTRKDSIEGGGHTVVNQWGRIASVTDSMLVLRSSRELRTNIIGNPTGTNVIINWNDPERPLSVVPLHGSSLFFTSKAARTSMNIGQSLMLVGALTALIVAPAASLQSVGTAMNGDRYLTIAGIGLAGIVLSVPLQVAGRGHTYRLTTPGHKGGKRDRVIVPVNQKAILSK